MSTTASAVIAKARSFLGIKEYPPNSNNVIFNTDYYGEPVSGWEYPWCCAFVWDIFRMVGAPELFYGGDQTASCTTLMNYGVDNGLSVVPENLQPGDLALFNWDGGYGAQYADHIGIVETNNSDGTIKTIEGNTGIGNDSNGGEVMERTRNLGVVVCGYRPQYNPEVKPVKLNGIDCSTPITKETAVALKNAGYDFVCRYLAPEGYSKRLMRSEAQDISDAGLLIFCVYETATARPKAGRVNGEWDGSNAACFAKEIGIPTSACLGFAVDYDAQPEEYDIIAEYLAAAKAQIGGYMMGVYGSFAVVEEMRRRGIPDVLWQTYAWDKQSPEHATIYQYLNDQEFCGLQVDFDEAYSPAGMWALAPSDDIPTLVQTVTKKIGLAAPDYWIGRLQDDGMLVALFKKIAGVMA